MLRWCPPPTAEAGSDILPKHEIRLANKKAGVLE